MPTRIATTARNAACDAVVDLIDAGASAGFIEIRTGLQPTSPQDPATGTLLTTVVLADPAFGSAVNGVAGLQNTPRTSTAVASGTAEWARVFDSNNAAVMDVTVGVGGSGSGIELNTVSIASGVTVSITSGTVTMPE